MKFALLTLPAILLFTACTQPDPNEGWELYGDYITATDFVALDEVIDEFSEEEEKTMKIGGTTQAGLPEQGLLDHPRNAGRPGAAHDICQLQAFSYPTDAAGREIVAEGLAFKKSDFRERASPLCRRCQRTGRGNCGHYRT